MIISADGVGLRGLKVDLYGILGLAEEETNVLRVGDLVGALEGPLVGVLDGPLVGVLGGPLVGVLGGPLVGVFKVSVTEAFSMVAMGFLGLYFGLDGLGVLRGLMVEYLVFFTKLGWKLMSASGGEPDVGLSGAGVLANHSF